MPMPHSRLLFDINLPQANRLWLHAAVAFATKKPLRRLETRSLCIEIFSGLLKGSIQLHPEKISIIHTKSIHYYAILTSKPFRKSWVNFFLNIYQNELLIEKIVQTGPCLKALSNVF